MAGAVPQISVQDVKNKLDNGEDVFLLDVRTPEEYDTAHIDGSHLFPMDEIPTRLDELREAIQARPVITICHHGVRSYNVAAALLQRGFEDVSSMSRGIDAWSVEIDASVPRY